MWTFLGIASFTYIYKKCDAVLEYAHKEIILAAVVFLAVGMLLSYVRYHGHTFKVPQILQLPLELLLSLPVINTFIPKPSAVSHRSGESASKKVSNDNYNLLKNKNKK